MTDFSKVFQDGMQVKPPRSGFVQHGQASSAALHPNFVPIRCAKLRLCPRTLCEMLGARKKTRAQNKKPKKKKIGKPIQVLEHPKWYLESRCQ
jgi:hypothetical protein